MERQELEDRLRELEARRAAYRLDELRPLVQQLESLLEAWEESCDHFHRLVSEAENVLDRDRAAIENVRDALRSYRSEQDKAPWWKKAVLGKE